MLNSSSRTAVQAANRLLVTPPRSEGLSAAPGCHAERSEASACPSRQMLRCAQHDSSDSGPGSPSPLTEEVLSPNVWDPCRHLEIRLPVSELE